MESRDLIRSPVGWGGGPYARHTMDVPFDRVSSRQCCLTIGSTCHPHSLLQLWQAFFKIFKHGSLLSSGKLSFYRTGKVPGLHLSTGRNCQAALISSPSPPCAAAEVGSPEQLFFNGDIYRLIKEVWLWHQNWPNRNTQALSPHTKSPHALSPYSKILNFICPLGWKMLLTACGGMKNISLTDPHPHAVSNVFTQWAHL